MRVLVAGLGRHLREHIFAELRAYGHDVTVIEEDALGDFEDGTAGDAVAVVCGLETCVGPETESLAEEDLSAEHALLRQVLSAAPSALVLLSSAAVYRVDGDIDRLDEQSETGPTTRLGRHALELERDARGLATAMHLPLVVLRTSIVAGAAPGVASGGRVLKAGALLPGLTVSGLDYPLMKTRYVPEHSEHPRIADFVSASDVATAVRLASERLDSGCEIPEVLHISSGVALSPDHVLEVLATASNINVDVEPGGRVPTRERRIALSPALAETTLGWSPATHPEKIVDSELAFLRERSFASCNAAKKIRIINEHLGATLSTRFLSIWGVLIARDRTGGLDYRDLSFSVNGEQYAADFFPRGGLRLPRPRSWRFALYRLRIPRQATEVLPAQTGVRLVYSGPKSRWFDVPLGFAQLSRVRIARHSRLFPVHDGSSRLFVRQTGGNRLFLTLRERNVTDTLRSSVKVFAARVAALIHSANAVLLYEKESSRYEESASVVFESLLDSGRDDVYFILDAKKLDRVPERYRSHVIKRFSFRHYYHFFSARTLIGTELVGHAIELRTIDKFLQRRLQTATFGFVFLQHGVMYMIALSSSQRSFFRAGAGFPADIRIVCSSEREKRHFVELGGFRSENMYVCGLPKFDHAVRDPDADRILIMPTWRPWEYNTVRTNPEQSGYFAMLAQMFDTVPEHLKEFVWILPHPLVRESLMSTALASHLWDSESYDSALRRAAVLITDYSSIAYDAFYRGANVVFWWKDKDECMRRYGGHLMLEERTAFGPVCYDAAALHDAVSSAYSVPQDPEHVRRYKEIVDFRDGRNTQRLIEMMERDRLV